MPVDRSRVQVLRRADLLYPAAAQHDEAVGHRQRLLLVVGDVHRRQPEGLVQPADLGAHLQPQFGVQIGQWFVHQDQCGFQDDGAGDGHSLLLAAGQLARELARLVLEMDQADRLVGAPPHLGPRQPAHLQSEGDVLADGQVREQGVVLEHHAEPAPFRWQRIQPGAVLPDLPAAERQQPGQTVERGGLAATGRAEEGDELAPLDGQSQIGEGVVRAEAAGDAFEP
ncbi:hypothetical protein GCM10009558_040310 [Virgisporangium aurantiacum]